MEILFHLCKESLCEQNSPIPRGELLCAEARQPNPKLPGSHGYSSIKMVTAESHGHQEITGGLSRVREHLQLVALGLLGSVLAIEQLES